MSCKIAFHPEDDPMEKHDHPTARQRLGDLEAGLGSAATMTFDDAEAIRKMRAASSTSPAASTRTSRVHLGDKRWFTRMHGTDVMMPSIKRALDVHRRPLLHRARAGPRRRR